jgi:hypothetical protein
MANIQNELNNIKNALYGKDVRSSIYDGLVAINNELQENIEGRIILEGSVNEHSISPKCVGENEINFIKVISENLFSKNTVSNYKIVDGLTGKLRDHENGCTSDFIKVEADNVYSQVTPWEGAFYDKDKKFISKKEYGLTTFTTPLNAHFYRYSVRMNSKHEEMFVKGNFQLLWESEQQEVNGYFSQILNVFPIAING